MLALAEVYAASLGGWAALSPVKANDVRRAAALVALSERAQEKHMRGDELVSLDDVVRAERVASLAVKRLGLRAEAGPKAPSLDEYLAQKAAAR